MKRFAIVTSPTRGLRFAVELQNLRSLKHLGFVGKCTILIVQAAIAANSRQSPSTPMDVTMGTKAGAAQGVSLRRSIVRGKFEGMATTVLEAIPADTAYSRLPPFATTNDAGSTAAKLKHLSEMYHVLQPETHPVLLPERHHILQSLSSTYERELKPLRRTSLAKKQ